MNYTKYFAKMLSVQGVPNFSNKAFQLYMNIVFMEGQIKSLEDAKHLAQANKGALDYCQKRLGEKIRNVAQNKSPEEFLEYLFRI